MTKPEVKPPLVIRASSLIRVSGFDIRHFPLLSARFHTDPDLRNDRIPLKRLDERKACYPRLALQIRSAPSRSASSRTGGIWSFPTRSSSEQVARTGDRRLCTRIRKSARHLLVSLCCTGILRFLG